ncbi:hypothetical protein [Nonomuraea sediminis]|uniref:hypothetical protein n=1 Tax=Nonomuraea sediminis TaxID=2835864 RepID=UPI001BDBC1B0|nr:hypothetical protein [Nonomuraea sediminis]
MATTSQLATVTTTTTLKTLLQIASPSTRVLRIVEWGISFDGSAAATPIACELIQTDVAATVTAHVSAGVQPFDDPNAPASLVQLGTSLSGYNASVEGTTTATRTADVQLVSPTTSFVRQWPLGREFVLPPSKFLRVRVKATGTGVNAYAYVVWSES